MVIDYGGEVDLTGTLTPPVALTESAVADVRRVIIYTSILSNSKIEKLTGDRVGSFDIFFGDADVVF